MTPDPVSQNDTSYEAQVLASKKLKKRILIVLGASVGAVLVLLLLVLLLEGIQRSMNTPEVPEYEFYPTYTGDIQKNPAYLNLDREVVYAYDATGVGFSTTITEECRICNSFFDCDTDRYGFIFSSAELEQSQREYCFA